MRSTRRTVIAALTAALALAVIGSASASAALPEFTGAVLPKAYETSLGKVTFELNLSGAEGNAISCQSGSDAGKITGHKTLTAKFAFKNCHPVGYPRITCTTAGAASGEIKTGELNASLVYISKANKEVGIDFNPYEKEKELEYGQPTFALFNCEGAREIISRAVIVPITPINTSTTKFTLTFAQKQGVQKPTKYENEEGKLVTNTLQGTFQGGGEMFEMGMEVAGTPTMTLTGAPLELKA
jgi:hypothetical protein